MKYFRWLVVFLVVRPAYAEFFPPDHTIFRPLRADPREIQYALRLLVPVSHKLLGEAAIGDYLPFYRWKLKGGGVAQMNIGGGAFGRFDLSATTNDMEVIDFYGNLPFDYRKGPWSTRFMVYHTSSHLGDDYLKRRGGVTDKHSWDNLRWLESYDWSPRTRLYGGYTYVFRTLPGGIGRHALQAGFELQSRWVVGKHLQYYWANDFQTWERASWNPMINSQVGMTFANKPGDLRAVSVFLEFTSGRQPQGQYYRQQETRWSLGVQFHLT